MEANAGTNRPTMSPFFAVLNAWAKIPGNSEYGPSPSGRRSAPAGRQNENRQLTEISAVTRLIDNGARLLSASFT